MNIRKSPTTWVTTCGIWWWRALGDGRFPRQETLNELNGTWPNAMDTSKLVTKTWMTLFPDLTKSRVGRNYLMCFKRNVSLHLWKESKLKTVLTHWIMLQKASEKLGEKQKNCRFVGWVCIWKNKSSCCRWFLLTVHAEVSWEFFKCIFICMLGLPSGICGSESTCQCRRCKRHAFESGSERSPGVGSGIPLQYSCLENPWTEEPGGLQSTRSQRVRYNWATKHRTTQ